MVAICWLITDRDRPSITAVIRWLWKDNSHNLHQKIKEEKKERKAKKQQPRVVENPTLSVCWCLSVSVSV